MAGYDYGPPVTTGEEGTPADTTGDVVSNEGDSPHEPPDNADTVTEPGGSPSDESREGADPYISGLTPDTAVTGADVTMTVTGSMFSANCVVEVDHAAVETIYVSPTELTATVPDPGSAGTVEVTVRNPDADEESNSVSFEWTDVEEEA